ncbi:MAG: enoyl-CoA hydratase-related protein [Xanthobacteraceae bacterium]
MRRIGAAEVGRITGATPKLAEYQGFYRHVLLDDMEGVKIVALRRPEALNTLHYELTDEILTIIRPLEAEAVGFVPTGYDPRAYCSGADMGQSRRARRRASPAQYARDCSCISTACASG